MKSVILIMCMLAFMTSGLAAQSSQRGKSAKKATVTKKKGVSAKAGKSEVARKTAGQEQKGQPAVQLNHTGTYAGKSAVPVAPAAYQRFTIADPIINTLNAQAISGRPLVSPSGIVGMPRRAYGLANGQIIFRSTVAPSSGTITGSGSVGTGTSLGAAGSFGYFQAINGKSPYAGPTIWGERTIPGRKDLAPAPDTTRAAAGNRKQKK